MQQARAKGRCKPYVPQVAGQAAVNKGRDCLCAGYHTDLNIAEVSAQLPSADQAEILRGVCAVFF